MIIRSLGTRDYRETWQDMIRFASDRTSQTPDETWLLQHDPVFTQGTSCIDMPSANPDSIPVIHSDRGGQITYHGPGQLISYFMVDLKRMGSGPKSFVNFTEQLAIEFLDGYGITGMRRDGAPGVYVDGAKIAALGLRVKRGTTYHGLSINIDMDLSPFALIDPCGYPGLEVTSLKQHVPTANMDDAIARFGQLVLEHFNNI